MKHNGMFVLLFLIALSLTAMGQENAGGESEILSKQAGETTDAVNSISIVGEVDYPGIYIMSKPLTLRDAILFAGGLDVAAARYGYIYRRIKEGEMAQDSDLNDQTKLLENPESLLPGTKIIRIDLEPMKMGGVLEPNILMEVGDTLFIPRRKMEYFYVIGEVVSPGRYEARWRKPLLVSHAISYAGGATITAKMSEGIMIRNDDKGERQQIKFDLGAILHGESEDFEIVPGDIIFIPGSQNKTLEDGLLRMLDNLVNRKNDTPKFYVIG